MQSFMCCVISMPAEPHRSSLILLNLKKLSFQKWVLSIQQQPKKPVKIDLSLSSSSGPLLSSFQSATWCWSPATPVTCPAVWTGSTSRSTRLKITWWFCARRRWPLNRNEAYLGLTHRESRPSRANTDTHTNKQQQRGMKTCPFYPSAAFCPKFCTQLILNGHIFCQTGLKRLISQTHYPVQINKDTSER